MTTPTSPFSFLDNLFERVGNHVQPPAWAVQALQHRVVLFLNHVLQQEPLAQQRLLRLQNRVVQFEWRFVTLRLIATPAGLVDLAPIGALAELHLHVTQASPLMLAHGMLRGEKPAVRIEGDVQLAAEVNWLVDHVRWDVEDDLARLVGNVPAHAIVIGARRMAVALRRFTGGAAADSSGSTGAG